MLPEDGSAEVSNDAIELIERLIERAFGSEATLAGPLADINQGRGAFSAVLRVGLAWTSPRIGDQAAPSDVERPRSVVAKLPIAGPNGVAAATSGAYRRESLAYREVLGRTPVVSPRAWAVLDDAAEETTALLLEDLGNRRMVDQIDGLDVGDAIAVAGSLSQLHRAWAGQVGELDGSVRQNTLSGLSADGLDAGLRSLEERWSDVLDGDQRAAFTELRGGHAGLAERFGAEAVTLCHGDPRADNLAFDDDGRPVLFDWQQMAIQFGEADLAWLAATSLTVETRRQAEQGLVEAGAGEMERYRLGLALPGLAVLFLAQRELPNERARRFVATSLQRIAAAVIDNETATLA